MRRVVLRQKKLGGEGRRREAGDQQSVLGNHTSNLHEDLAMTLVEALESLLGLDSLVGSVADLPHCGSVGILIDHRSWLPGLVQRQAQVWRARKRKRPS